MPSADREQEVIDHIARDARSRGAQPGLALAAMMLELARRGAAGAEVELRKAQADYSERQRLLERCREKLRTGLAKYTPEWCATLEARSREESRKVERAQRRIIRARADVDGWQVNLLQALRDFGPTLDEANRASVRKAAFDEQRRASDLERAAVR